jgi:hypothetical protein
LNSSDRLVRLRALCGAAAIAVLVSGAYLAWPAAQELPHPLSPPFAERGTPVGEPAQICGTVDETTEARIRLRPLSVLPDNTPLWFDQDPTLLTADYRGIITLRNLLVTGDIESIQFRPVGNDPLETWTRTGITEIGSRLISVFSPSWTQQQLTSVFQGQEFGFDSPYLYLGEVLPPGVSPGGGYGVYLRVLSNSIPQVTVIQVADDVQYSSAVVNIRADDFGYTELLDDENAFSFDRVTRRFYELFQDSYDSIGITTESVRLTTPSYNAFHLRVRNDVKGIGQSIFDGSARYGSAGRLSGIEFFTAASMTTNRALAHETAHRWSSFIDWSKLLGITAAGHQPTAHEPLMTGGETRIGAVLEGNRRVVNAGGSWTIQRTPAPILFHPYTLYAMGVLAPEAVPEIAFFENQAQFNASGVSAPAIGTVVSGDAKTATAFNVIGMVGPREGPVPSTWDQALVVVSSGRLLSRREMDYWTFYSQRTADPNGTGVITWTGYGSFDAATSRRVDLTHEIRPRGGDPIREPLAVDAPRFAPSDFREIVSDAPVPTLYDVGERFRITGRVTASDRNDFSSVLVGLYRDPGGDGNFIRGDSRLGSNGTFDIATPVFTADQRGQWIIEVFLFWPGSGSQQGRFNLGPITVR